LEGNFVPGRAAPHRSPFAARLSRSEFPEMSKNNKIVSLFYAYRRAAAAESSIEIILFCSN
jgi:hypothetical protein